MKKVIKKYLFTKNILVSEEKELDFAQAAAAAFALAEEFAIRIVKGGEYADKEMIALAAETLGQNVPEPFYRGFPDSVRALTKRKLLFDQLLHYARTYGTGDFSEAGHSLFEERLKRIAFTGKSVWKDFVAVREEEGVKRAEEYAFALLSATRPLSDTQYEFVKEVYLSYALPIADCPCKATAVRMLVDTRDLRFVEYLSLSDAVKVVAQLAYDKYENENLNKLNFCNQDRKFIACVLDKFFALGKVDTKTCYEKKAVWCGLLHHIHYRPKTDAGKAFVDEMRGKGNKSAYADFEREMRAERVSEAAKILRREKGSTAVLRKLNYLISRVKSEEEMKEILALVSSENRAVLLQLLYQYAFYGEEAGRIFRFAKFQRIVVHEETAAERKKRRSTISKERAKELCDLVRGALVTACKGKLGKVYLDEDMKKIAVPIQESTAIGGYGALPKGSRVAIEEGQTVRAFTYWEKVNDIDLSAIGLTETGEQVEFSWRSFGSKSRAITFSGDQTSGYHGGSEFFDIDFEAFRKKYPDVKYLILCDNVYTGIPFSQCVCRAGVTVRGKRDGGRVFEPKTVKTSFLVDCASTFAYLFAIDMSTRELVWLNCARAGKEQVAGRTRLAFLDRYLQALSVTSVYALFEMLASEVVKTPDEAEIILSDREEDAREGKAVVRSWEFEKMQAYL